MKVSERRDADSPVDEALILQSQVVQLKHPKKSIPRFHEALVPKPPTL